MKKLLLSLILAQGLIAAPIHYAAMIGDVDEVKRILSQNSSSGYLDENITNDIHKFGKTPLDIAAENGNAEVVEMLIRHGANVNAVNNSDGCTPLHIATASGYGNAEIIEMLIRQNANVDAVNNNGCTPLHIAAFYGKAETVEILIRHDADVNAVDSDGCTPLHYAASNYHEKIVEMLIIYGANVNGVDSRYGSTPLHRTAHNCNVKIVKILLEDPLCDHTITDNHNKTPEEVAHSRGHPDIANLLHNAPSVNKKIFNSGRRLQLFAARVANKDGITKDELNVLPYNVRRLITNIRKDKKPSYLKEDEADPSGYHSDDEELQHKPSSI